MKISNFIIALISMQTVTAAVEKPWHSHSDILAVAENFVLGQLQHINNAKVSFGQIDKRLQFKACHEPLEAFLPSGSQLRGNTTIGVRCASTNVWQYYLPANIIVFERVVVAASPIAKRQRLKASDLKLIDVDVSYIRTKVFSDPKQLVGSLVKRAIRPGKVISGQSICLVCQGEKIKIIAKSKNISVEMNGIALQDGIEGDIIVVKNLASQKKVEAKVTRAGRVKVLF